jgi:hypothetical protein
LAAAFFAFGFFLVAAFFATAGASTTSGSAGGGTVFRFDAFFADAFLVDAFFADAFLVVAFFADAFLVVAFFADAFLVVAFLAAAFFTAAFFADAFLVAAFFTAVFFAAAFFTAVLRTRLVAGASLLAGSSAPPALSPLPLFRRVEATSCFPVPDESVVVGTEPAPVFSGRAQRPAANFGRDGPSSTSRLEHRRHAVARADAGM